MKDLVLAASVLDAIRIDLNADGFIPRGEAKGRPALQKRFDEIDTDHDQRLSREELRAARRQQRDHKA